MWPFSVGAAVCLKDKKTKRQKDMFLEVFKKALASGQVPAGSESPKLKAVKDEMLSSCQAPAKEL